MVFIETTIFTEQVRQLLDDEAYAALQELLAQHPEAGDLIKGTGGLRKIRVAAKGHGKRGGGRVIYYHFVTAHQIVMLLAYPKNTQDDLTADQKKALCAIIEHWR